AMLENESGVCLLYTLTDNSEGIKGTSGPVKYEEDLLKSVLKENLDNARIIGTDTACFNSGEEEKMYRFIHLKRTRENVLSLKHQGDKTIVVVYNTDHN
ncbi:MAG: hypothetical protein VYD98_05010, partial [Bacteroidota bacterium]|nr:hypothetical protein [Bacteroidota bacterium]